MRDGSDRTSIECVGVDEGRSRSQRCSQVSEIMTGSLNDVISRAKKCSPKEK